MKTRHLFIESLLIALGVAVLLTATSGILPMSWDEGNAVLRSDRIIDWSYRLVGQRADHTTCYDDSPTAPRLVRNSREFLTQQPDYRPLSGPGTRFSWQFIDRIEGHPSFYATVITAGRALAAIPQAMGLIPRDGRSALTAVRLGPMLLFALATGAVYWRMSRDWSRAAGLASVVAICFIPRLFAHAHFASFDGPLTSCWLICWATFSWACGSSGDHEKPNTPGCQRPAIPMAGVSLHHSKGREQAVARSDANTAASSRWMLARRIVWGFLLGMTLSCKFTGWLAPVPLIVWAILYRRRDALVTLAIGLPAALATFYLLNPPLWFDPVGGLIDFFRMNLSRDGFNIAVLFLGRMYNLDFPLPWYNSWVWVGVTVPIGLLLLTLVGVGRVLQTARTRPEGMLLLLCGLTLIVIRMTPYAPPHDGTRLFITSFAFLALLSGVGFDRLWHFSGDSISTNKTRALRIVAVLLLAGSSFGLVRYSPQWLSYYNCTISGLDGAARAGMEPTYYWDSLDRFALNWLSENTLVNEKVRFGSSSGENLYLMHRWGTLRVEHHERSPGSWRWYVMQRRPSGNMPHDHWLMQNAEPAYRKSLGGVPLLEIYRYDDYQQAQDAVYPPAERR